MSDNVIKSIDQIITETKKQIQPYIFQRFEARKPRSSAKKIAKTIAVASGKGGVGKTSFVANLAIALAQANKKVIILDADLGLANIDVVFGVRPKRNLLDVIKGGYKLEEILVNGPCGVQIIAGGSGISELAYLSEDHAKRLFSEMRYLEDKTDYLIIDTGAGIGENVIRFCISSDEIVIITTPEPTALADAYGIIKILSMTKPESKVNVLVNRVSKDSEGEFVFQRLSSVTNNFLGFKIFNLGYVPDDLNVSLSIRQQTPLLLFSPMSPAAKKIREIAKSIFIGTRDLASNNSEENNDKLPVSEQNNGGIAKFISCISSFFTKNNNGDCSSC